MPFVLTDLVIDRVDLVDEGANSAAFVELYKRKERSEVMDANEIIAKMKPEHAEVIQETLEKAKQDLEARESELSAANEALAKANAELDELKKASCSGEGEGKKDDESDDESDDTSKACGDKTEKAAGGASFDESEVLKSMPEAARELFVKMREQKEAAEEQVRKAAEEKEEAEAVAKAATMKALPIEQEKLVGILKSCSPEIAELLGSCNAALEGVVLDEVGKSAGNGAATGQVDAWAKIEAKAEEVAKRDTVTKAKAIQIAINENPELYREYINGGAN